MIKGTGEDIHPTTLQSIQEEVEGRPEQMVYFNDDVTFYTTSTL